jgi:hypothetical protein
MMPILHSDHAGRKKELTERITIPHFELLEFSLTDHRSETPYAEETLKLNVDNYCPVMGTKILLPLNLLSKIKEKAVNPATRKTDIFFRRAKRVSDTVLYKIPDTYLIESLPPAASMETPFGSYSMKADTSGQQITYIRTLELKKGTFPASLAKEFESFYLSVQRQDNAKAILKKR